MGRLDFLYRIEPVSYTHLDVYKRQGRRIRGMLSLNINSASCSFMAGR